MERRRPGEAGHQLVTNRDEDGAESSGTFGRCSCVRPLTSPSRPTSEGGEMRKALLTAVLVLAGGAILLPTPARASEASMHLWIAGVENGANVSTAVRVASLFGTSTVQFSLYKNDNAGGTLVASCQLPQVFELQLMNWCIQPSDFGDATVLLLEIRSSGSPLAVEAYVTKIIGEKGRQQVIERALNPVTSQ
jgi:hypothetical protein